MDSLQQQIQTFFTHPKTQKMMLDDYVFAYIQTAFQTLDYSDPASFQQLIEVIPPILTSLNVTASDEAAANILQEIFDLQLKDQNIVQVVENFTLSAGQLIEKEVQNQQLFKDKQSSRNLQGQRLEYTKQKYEQYRMQKEIKRAKKRPQAVAQHTAPTQMAEYANESTTSAQASAAAAITGSAAVQLIDLTLAFGNNVLLKNTTFNFHFGHRYCLVGRNGCGKSTLLKSIFSNEIHCVPNREKLSVLYVAQEVPSTSEAVIDVVLAADEEYVRQAREQKQLESIYEDFDSLKADQASIGLVKQLLETDNLAELTEEDVQDALDALAQQQQASFFYQKRSQASQILSGLKFTPTMQAKPTKELSGGWKMRVALARAMFIEPDILMLDEPTNNLDLLATLWLEEQLVHYSPKSLLIVVSHDIQFIDNFATDVVILTDKTLKVYSGNYTSFARSRGAELQNNEKMHEKEQARRAHVEQFINRFRYNANRANLVQSRIKALNKMAVTELSVEQLEEFHFPMPYAPDEVFDHLNPLVELADVNFAYDEEKLGGFQLKNLNFRVFPDSRIAICGANAAGKSTILKLIAGYIKPIAGEVKLSKQASFAVFWQHHTEQLDLEETAYQHLLKLAPDAKESEIRAHLSNFGLGQDLIRQTARTLSGGQKTRLSLALLTFKVTPRILILDEPTNHIDVETKEALIDALQEYNGAIIIVSHDGPFVNAVTDEMYVVNDGEIAPYEGGFDAYREELRRIYK